MSKKSLRENEMMDHEEAKHLLALAAAGALDADEEAALSLHTAACAECAREMQQWSALGAGLRRLPTPQPSAALIERTRLMATARLLAQDEIRSTRRLVAIAIAFAWVTGLASWPLMRLLGRVVLGWADAPATGVWLPLVGYTVVAVICTTLAAGLLGLRTRNARRTI